MSGNFFSICPFLTTNYLLEISFYLFLSPFLFSLKWTKFSCLLSSLTYLKMPWPTASLVTPSFIAVDGLCWLCRLNLTHLSIFFITRNPQSKFFLHQFAMAEFKFASSTIHCCRSQRGSMVVCSFIFSQSISWWWFGNWKSWVLRWLVFGKGGGGCFFVFGFGFGFGFLGYIWWDVVVYLGLWVVWLDWWCGWEIVVEIGFMGHSALQRYSCGY